MTVAEYHRSNSSIENMSAIKPKLLCSSKKIVRENGISIWLTDNISKKDIDTIFQDTLDPSSETAPEGARLLKKARQRLVYEIEAKGLPCNKAVIKMFPLKNPFSRFKYRKYARREFINYHKALDRNVPVPKVYAYIEKRRFGFVTGSGIIIESLEGQRDLMDVASKSPTGYANAAKLGIPALVALFNSGASHIDARDENIFLSDHNNSTNFCFIDWQYAGFHDARSEWMLEHLASYYIRHAPAAEQTILCGEWLAELHKQANHETSFDIFSKRVEALLSSRQSVRARLSLRPANVV